MNCFDFFHTLLHVGDAVMCVQNGNETEGIITALLSDNRIKIDCENGTITALASDCYYLP